MNQTSHASVPFPFQKTSQNASTFYTFLHGFTPDSQAGGGAGIAKAVSLFFGVPIEQPNLNYPSFGEFSLSNALGVVDRLYENKVKQTGNKDVKMNLIGASMGGYVAARWAQLHPEKVNKLLLLCPAFELAQRWPSFLQKEQMDEWKKTGKMAYQGHYLHYNFYEDALKHPALPEVSCPTMVIHGKQDGVIPVASSRAFAKLHESKGNVKLIEVDDGHDLTKSAPIIIQNVPGFLL